MDPHDARLQTTDAGGDRPHIAASGSKSKYKPGSEIYLKEPGSRSLAGPYLVSTVTSEGTYILCLENGDKVKDAQEFEEKDLVKA